MAATMVAGAKVAGTEMAGTEMAGTEMAGTEMARGRAGVSAVSRDAGRVTVLVLGGTSEARALAADLAGRPGMRVISSLAGRVRDPVLPAGEVRVGGFGGVRGLADWVRAEGVDSVVDATHPFAETISAHAAAACAQADLPLLRLARPGWHAQDGDDWHHARSLAEAAALLPALGTRVFLTTGRQGLPAFAALDQLWFLIRCVDAPAGAMPANREVLLARGPYARESEHALMRRFAINVLVTKDSGGSLTAGKLAAARELGIPVVMIRRPDSSAAVSVPAVADAVRWVLGQVPVHGGRPPAGQREPDPAPGRGPDSAGE
jgi:precorrin-6A/cobalt-precorrin-6A reductase